MIFWSLVGTAGWALSVLFMLAVIKGGHMTRSQERRRYSRSTVNTQKKVQRSLDYASSM